MAETSGKCMTEKCDKEAQWKGLCRSCYGQARQLIDSGETTWEELGNMGLVQLAEKPFKEAFRARKAAVARQVGEAERLRHQKIEEAIEQELDDDRGRAAELLDDRRTG